MSDRACVVIAFACAMQMSAGIVLAQLRPAYLYTLSDFSGPLRYDWVRISVDQERNESYVIYQDLVRIFNASGMEIFSFGEDLGLGHIVDLAVDSTGEIILLSYKDSRPAVTRCNFRGVPVAPIPIENLPAGVVFEANRIVHRDGLFYFASLSTSTVTVTDSNGRFRKRLEFLPLIEAEERQKGGAEMFGFAVDREGNILFSIPSLFKVFRFSPHGTLTSFGRPGSGTGRFGVVAGVSSDRHGNILVADKLRCVVMVFGPDFQFLTEFGYRGARPENLIVPHEIAIDGNDRLYVSQGRRRGVSVFALGPG